MSTASPEGQRGVLAIYILKSAPVKGRFPRWYIVLLLHRNGQNGHTFMVETGNKRKEKENGHGDHPGVSYFLFRSSCWSEDDREHSFFFNIFRYQTPIKYEQIICTLYLCCILSCLSTGRLRPLDQARWWPFSEILLTEPSWGMAAFSRCLFPCYQDIIAKLW